jgi:protein-S-isoprenylcysteine O-methyltransferase Ste14
MKQPKIVLRGAIVLYFVIGLEILIMISPAAGFFYAAFNPFLLSLAKSPATRWLTAFYLPHMVLPPDLFLKTIRVAGSFLFVTGFTVFLLCAGQVYYRKFARKGVALGGLYSRIRHPQYLGLGMAGIGLSILWPRFLVIALWTFMAVLYFLLARDEERRMLGQFGDEYRQYMDRTGMFLPRRMEDTIGKLLPIRNAAVRATMIFLVLSAVTLGGAFALRAYTVNRLPLWSEGPVTALAILPGDLEMMRFRMASVLDLQEIRTRLEREEGPYLVYFMPMDYVMQGMIADTGGEWQLYRHHRTLAMIWDWIFHPFRHLEGGGHGGIRHHTGGLSSRDGAGGMVRRMTFIAVDPKVKPSTPADDFKIDAVRIPRFVADVDIHTLEVKEVRDLPPGTGWGKVPTPMF